MAVKRYIHARAIAVLVMAYLVGLIAYPALPGPFLGQKISARILVAFTLPTTALVIDTLFRSLWNHDRIPSGNGAFESTYHAIVLRVLGFAAQAAAGLHPWMNVLQYAVPLGATALAGAMLFSARPRRGGDARPAGGALALAG